MDLEKLLLNYDQHNNNNHPACITECPIHIDIYRFIEVIKKSNFEEAYKILSERIPLTNVIVNICDHPCENACITYCEGKEISIHELEKAAVLYGNHKITRPPIPKNNKNIAVIGAGISGLTCAIDLNQKGYQVTIYDKENELGGSLLKIPDNIIDQNIVKEELDKFKGLDIKVNLKQKLSSMELKELSKDYHAIFIGTGMWEEELIFNNITLQTQYDKIFVGGRIVIGCNSVIQSVYTGRCAAFSIDRFVHHKSLTASREKEGTYESSLKISMDHKKIPSKIIPKNTCYTIQEAIKEANRCIQCK